MADTDRPVPRGRMRRTMPLAGFTARAAGQFGGGCRRPPVLPGEKARPPPVGPQDTERAPGPGHADRRDAIRSARLGERSVDGSTDRLPGLGGIVLAPSLSGGTGSANVVLARVQLA